MNKYILFGFWNYYPGGGLNDMQGTFDTFQEYTYLDVDLECDVYQIINVDNGEKKEVDTHGLFDDYNHDEKENQVRQYINKFVKSFVEGE